MHKRLGWRHLFTSFALLHSFFIQPRVCCRRRRASLQLTHLRHHVHARLPFPHTRCHMPQRHKCTHNKKGKKGEDLFVFMTIVPPPPPFCYLTNLTTPASTSLPQTCMRQASFLPALPSVLASSSSPLSSTRSVASLCILLCLSHTHFSYPHLPTHTGKEGHTACHGSTSA